MDTSDTPRPQGTPAPGAPPGRPPGGVLPAQGTGAPYDAVLCDLDNVVRFYDLTRLSELERAYGLPEGTTTGIAYAPGTDLPLLLGRITPDEWVAAIASGLAGRVGEERARELGEALRGAPFRADEAVVALLRRVRERMPLVLVTNATLQLEEDLALLGLTGLAHHVVSSALEGVAKPDPAIYRIAAARAGVPVDRCLFVDDRQENVDAAVALGMTGVLFREPDGLRGLFGFGYDEEAPAPAPGAGLTPPPTPCG